MEKRHTDQQIMQIGYNSVMQTVRVRNHAYSKTRILSLRLVVSKNFFLPLRLLFSKNNPLKTLVWPLKIAI